MEFKWTKDGGTWVVTHSLVYGETKLVKIVQYDADNLGVSAGAINPAFLKLAYETDIEKLKKNIETAIHEFCVEFEIWFMR